MGDEFFEWVNRRYVRITVAVLVAAVLFTGVTVAIGSDDEPRFDPSGEIYDTADRVAEVFAVTTGVQGALFLVEDPGQNHVLTRDALLEWATNSASLRAATREVGGDPLNSHLATVFNTNLNAEVDGVYSIADAVDAELPGGLEALWSRSGGVIRDLVADRRRGAPIAPFGPDPESADALHLGVSADDFEDQTLSVYFAVEGVRKGERAAIRADEGSLPGGEEHGVGRRGGALDPVQIQGAFAGRQASGDLFPGVTAIGATNYPGHFQPGVHLVREVRIRRQGDNPSGKGHLALVGAHARVELLPGIPTIHAAVNFSRRGAQIHHLGVPRPEQESPYAGRTLGVVQSLPVVAAIAAAVGPVVGTGINQGWIIRMQRNSLNLDSLRQSVGKGLPLVRPRGEPVQTMVFSADIDPRFAVGGCHLISSFTDGH